MRTTKAFGIRGFSAVAAVVTALLYLVVATPGALAGPPHDPTKGPLPVPFNILAGIAAAPLPEVPPPGANDWHCTPSPEHPRPVVLVNPTFTTQALAWQAGAPVLKNAGYCVFTFNFGNPQWLPGEIPVQALDDIRVSAETLSVTVDKVLAATGASHVDLVGHSQGGGILPDYYLKILGGSSKVHTKVGISPSNGTTLSEIAYLRTIVPVIAPAVYGSIEQAFPGLIQQVIDNPLNAEVYGSGDTVPGPNYYHIITKYDQVVTPADQQFYTGANVTDLLLQNECPDDHSEHIATLYSERAWRHVLNALDPSNATPVQCFHVAPWAPWVH